MLKEQTKEAVSLIIVKFVIVSYNRVKLGRVKQICVFEHSIITNFNCACPAIQRGQGSGFCLKVPLDSLLVCASSRGSGETARMRRLAWTFAARIGHKYQIRLTQPN